MGTDGNNYSETVTDADFALKSAVYYGISQIDTLVSQQTSRSCPGGNCTWNTFQSLAICSACADLTDDVEKVSIGEGVSMGIEFDNRNSPTATGNLTEYRLSNGLRLNNFDDSGELPEWTTLLMTGFGTSHASQSMSFSDRDTLIWSMAIMKVENDMTRSGQPITATECGLWYCVNEYNSSVQNGILSEVVTTVSSSRAPNSSQVSPKQESETQLKRPPSSTLSYDVESASVYRTDLQLGSDDFNVSQAAVYRISDFMSSVFTEKDFDVNGTKPGVLINAYVTNTSNIAYGPTVMQVLYQSQDLNATFAALAKSMTNTIRQNSDGGFFVVGKAGTSYTLIQDHWPFLILPAVLIIAAAVFLVIIVYHTRRAGIPVWCSNLLPSVALGSSAGAVFDKVILLSRMEEIGESHFVAHPRNQRGNPSNMEGVTHGKRKSAYEMVSQNGSQPKTANAHNTISEISYRGFDTTERTESNDHLL